LEKVGRIIRDFRNQNAFVIPAEAGIYKNGISPLNDSETSSE
jgi:hypothetical protein